MKVLIVYSSANGAAKEACEILAERLKDFSQVEIYSINDAPPSPEGYDVAVVGGSIRMNRLNKNLKKYISLNSEALSSIHSAAFICCGLTDDFDDYVTTEIPKSVSFSLGVHCFGGQLKPDKVHGLDKPIVYLMRQSILTQDPDKSERDRRELPELFPDTIYSLAERIHRLKMI